MSSLPNTQQFLTSLGYSNAGRAVLSASHVTVEFSSAPASGQGTADTRIDGDADFIVQAMAGQIYSADPAVATAVNNCPWPLEPSAVGASNTFAYAGQVRVNWSTNGTQWDQSQSYPRWTAHIGTAQRPFYLPTPRRLPAGARLQATLYNGSDTEAALASVTLHGCKVRNAQPPVN